MKIYSQKKVVSSSVEELVRGMNGTDVVSFKNGEAYSDWCVSSPGDVPDGFEIHATVEEWLSYSRWYDMNLISQARLAGEI